MESDDLIVLNHTTPAGPITVTLRGGKVTRLGWGTSPTPSATASATPAAQECLRQIDEYFAGKRHTFDLRLDTCGTGFQEAVWHQLQKIPYGHTASYAVIARAIGRPRAYRAVAQACHVNPIAIIIPCHRVIGSDGSLTGYAAGLGIKRHLLALESTSTSE